MGKNTAKNSLFKNVKRKVNLQKQQKEIKVNIQRK